jgi:hypothetical protein
VNSNKKLIDFGQVLYYPTTATKQDGLELTNNGSSAATIGTVSIVAVYGDVSQFSFASDCLSTLDPGKKCHINLSFTPSTYFQVIRATLKIPTSPGSTILIPLTGRGSVDTSQ